MAPSPSFTHDPSYKSFFLENAQTMNASFYYHLIKPYYWKSAQRIPPTYEFLHMITQNPSQLVHEMQPSSLYGFIGFACKVTIRAAQNES